MRLGRGLGHVAASKLLAVQQVQHDERADHRAHGRERGGRGCSRSGQRRAGRSGAGPAGWSGWRRAAGGRRCWPARALTAQRGRERCPAGWPRRARQVSAAPLWCRSTSTMVHPTARATNSSHRTMVLWRPAFAAQWPATSKTPAASAISATTVMATKKTRTGPTRVRRLARSGAVTPASPTRRAQRAETSRTQGCPVRAGSCRVTSKVAATTSASAGTDRGSSPISAEVAGDEAAGVLGHVGRPGDPDLHPAVGERALGSPRRGIRAGAAVHDHAPARRLREDGPQLGLPGAGERADAGEVDGHREAVGDDRVGGPHRPEEGRDHHDPPVRAASGGGVEAGVVERVVEHTGVDASRWEGWGTLQHEVAGDLAGQAGGDAERGSGVLMCARLRQGLRDVVAALGQLGEGQASRAPGAGPWCVRSWTPRAAAG